MLCCDALLIPFPSIAPSRPTIKPEKEIIHTIFAKEWPKPWLKYPRPIRTESLWTVTAPKVIYKQEHCQSVCAKSYAFSVQDISAV